MSPRRFAIWACLLVGVYGLGLTKDFTEPWYGVHDWNGAFFSQLARNFLRYPWSVHHGMPIVAAGATPPGPADSSIYATHPPALVWIVAGAFRVFGESEWAARLVPIVFSLATFVLLLCLTCLAYGRRVAALAGLFYAVMPMSVYFGRMVDHEAVCLFCMVAAASGWVLARGHDRGWRRWGGRAIVIAAFWLGIWVDWVVIIFAGLMAAWVGFAAIRKRGRWSDFFVIAIGGVAAVVTMVSFIVYQGLGGRWGDLVDIFLSRAEAHQDIKGAGTTEQWWWYVSDNVTWLLGILTIVGLIVTVIRRRRGAVAANSPDERDERVARGRTAARTGLNLIALTGVFWLLVFWKQFERHEYWMFYTGPVLALLAAVGISTLVEIAWRARATASVVALAVLVPVTVVVELSARNELFGRIHQVHPLAIEDWKAINRLTRPTDRVAMYDDPFRVERRGGYVFRNIVPPHLAWYMDRRMRVVEDIRGLPDSAPGCAVFVIDSLEAASVRDQVDPLLASWKYTDLNRRIVVDLRSPKAQDRPAVSEAED